MPSIATDYVLNISPGEGDKDGEEGGIRPNATHRRITLTPGRMVLRHREAGSFIAN